MNAETRFRITLDDQPVLEVDFVGLHIAMLYAEAGEDLDHDPYAISVEKLGGFPAKLQRKMAKSLALVSINAKDQTSAFAAFRDGFPDSHVGRRIRKDKLNIILDALVERNPPLKGHLFADKGIELMHRDAEITSRIHSHFTKRGVPVLSVHDSYLIDCWKVAELRQAMADASKAVVGIPLRTAIRIPGHEEYAPVSDYDLKVFIDNLNP